MRAKLTSVVPYPQPEYDDTVVGIFSAMETEGVDASEFLAEALKDAADSKGLTNTETLEVIDSTISYLEALQDEINAEPGDLYEWMMK